MRGAACRCWSKTGCQPHRVRGGCRVARPASLCVVAALCLVRWLCGVAVAVWLWLWRWLGLRVAASAAAFPSSPHRASPLSPPLPTSPRPVCLAAKQRLGRAGRVRPGICYGLYTRARFEHRMRRYQVGTLGRTLTRQHLPTQPPMGPCAVDAPALFRAPASPLLALPSERCRDTHSMRVVPTAATRDGPSPSRGAGAADPSPQAGQGRRLSVEGAAGAGQRWAASAQQGTAVGRTRGGRPCLPVLAASSGTAPGPPCLPCLRCERQLMLRDPTVPCVPCCSPAAHVRPAAHAPPRSPLLRSR